MFALLSSKFKEISGKNKCAAHVPNETFVVIENTQNAIQGASGTAITLRYPLSTSKSALPKERFFD